MRIRRPRDQTAAAGGTRSVAGHTDGDAHAAADAQGGKAPLRVAPHHLGKERHQDAGPRGTDRVAERNGATIDVQLISVELQLAADRQRLSGKGFVGEGDAFRTEDGVRNFAVGDQIVFLRNERALGVKSGMIGHIFEARPGWFVAKATDGETRTRPTASAPHWFAPLSIEKLKRDQTQRIGNVPRRAKRPIARSMLY
ncbi:hypothetical protein KL86PLE_90073 [uncultured Pleomorphomonas sp.]|uniref:Uncharacterized protein n=1 Tax=uncultured Pleomorphomonas sp. TaxID=442121 RepID=A0A212LMK3_9HYPH|nr:hypothetical protein KL86PLE_90073 [uncultured Pleomorphomonas sp.]